MFFSGDYDCKHISSMLRKKLKLIKVKIVNCMNGASNETKILAEKYPRRSIVQKARRFSIWDQRLRICDET